MEKEDERLETARMATKTTVDFDAFSIEELKEKLRVLGAKTSGNKVELINRLLRMDLSCEWAKPSENQESSEVG